MKSLFPLRIFTLLGVGYFTLHLLSIFKHMTWIYITYEILFVGYILAGSLTKSFLKQSALLHIGLTFLYIYELFIVRRLPFFNSLSALVLYPAIHHLIGFGVVSLRKYFSMK
ncbi:MAG: hypothetical protein C7N14_06455 [Bacteroidetes bacterium]|nr:MAG: hypothetical protein C7N14_06455 [Bacteroidota bacterium]